MTLVTPKSISIVLPAYNEETNIAQMLEKTIETLTPLFHDWEILIVNDGSRDRTGDIINQFAVHNERVIPIHHPLNQGYGAALKSGIQRACKQLVFFCDADLQFSPLELLLPLMWIDQYDLVIGYRAKRRDPWHRSLNANAWNLLVRLLLGLKVRDIDCAFKLFHSYVFSTIQIDAVGAMVNTDILVQASQMGFKIKEIPVTHFPRPSGASTGANPKVILKAFRELFRLHSKLNHIPRLVAEQDRRQNQRGYDFTERRTADPRRQVLLPINCPDRRRRELHINGHYLPLSDNADLYQPLIVDPSASHPIDAEVHRAD